MALSSRAACAVRGWRDSIERIVIRHDLANGASGRVAEKLGFGEIDRVAVEVMAEGESGVDLIRELIRPERF